MTSTYAAAGVDIEAGNEVVRRIKPHAKRTFIPGVLSGVGGFGALFQPDLAEYSEPVLVSSTDGVGTKLKIAFDLKRHDTIGLDLVAMCANDVLCCGARPLFFLDYFATGKLAPPDAEAVVKGIADGCEQAGCALIGGETAEMPGFYAPGEYDVAGFCVGIADKSKLIDGSTIQDGDVIIGVASSGLHSNGYSLARRVLEPLGYDTFNDRLGATIGSALLEPTRIYVQPILELMKNVSVKGIVHITGGGFYENIPRVLPPHIGAVIQRSSWVEPPIFELLREQGSIEEREMFTTFNMGIGLVLVLGDSEAETTIEFLSTHGLSAYRIGTTRSTPVGAEVVELHG